MTRHRHSCGHVHDCEASGPAVPPGGEELREAIVAVTHAHHKLYDRDECSCGASTRQDDVDVFHEHRADAVLALDAVRDALAAQQKLRRVEELADWYAAQVEWQARDTADRIRRALAGEP